MLLPNYPLSGRSPLSFGVGATGADQLATTGAAAVSGVNTISITGAKSNLSVGSSYNLITVASRRNGRYVFANGPTFDAAIIKRARRRLEGRKESTFGRSTFRSVK
jgi:hypothetical protein